MTPPINVRPAAAADWPRIAALLLASGLPRDGAQPHVNEFVLAERAGDLLGCAGLERYGEAALLRSVAVHGSTRGMGLGRRLVEAALEQARAGGTRRVVLLTETARDYFPRFGFREISRAEAPAAVQASVEFVSACPASAVVMALDLADGPEDPAS